MGTQLRLRIRRNLQHGHLCDVWVLGKDGPSEFGMLHGTVSSDKAELLAESLGLPVTREDQPNPVVDGAVEERAKKTQLF